MNSSARLRQTQPDRSVNSSPSARHLNPVRTEPLGAHGRTLGRPSYVVESVDNAFRLLNAIRDTGAMRLRDAALEIGVAESTAHRLLAMLVYHGYVVRDGQRRYVAGPAVGLGPAESTQTRALRGICLPAMRRLSAEIDETVNVVVGAGVRIRIIGAVESTRLIRAGNMVGLIPPAYGTSGGRILLSELSDEEVVDLYETADPSEQLSPFQFQELLKSLRTVRASQCAMAIDLIEKGLTGVGTALRNREGTAIGALTVALPTSRLRPGLDSGLLTHLRRAAAEIEPAIIGFGAEGLNPLHNQVNSTPPSTGSETPVT